MNELSCVLVATTSCHDCRQAIGPDTVQLTPIQPKQKADRTHCLFEKSILAGCSSRLTAKNMTWPLRPVPGFVLLGSDAPPEVPEVAEDAEGEEAKAMSTKRLSCAAALLGAVVGAFLPFPDVPAGSSREPRLLTSMLDLPDTEQIQATDAARAPSAANADMALLEFPSGAASP